MTRGSDNAPIVRLASCVRKVGAARVLVVGGSTAAVAFPAAGRWWEYAEWGSRALGRDGFEEEGVEAQLLARPAP